MKKIFFLAIIAAVFVSCEEIVGDSSLIEGAWELITLEYDGTVSADQNGQTHYSDKPYTKQYENKENVWLFKDNYITKWSQSTQKGEIFWSGYEDDASHSYVVEGAGQTMVIVKTSKSIIPGMEDRSFVTRYKVEKLTKNQMILTTTETPFISDLNATVKVNEKYSFKRENTLEDFLKSVQ